MAMNDLIARLEAATGPDRELDAEIYRTAVGLGMYETIVHRFGDFFVRNYPGPPEPEYRRLPRYTASLDAAMTLVPADAYWIFGKGRTRPDEPLFGFQILDPATNDVIAEAEHENREICVCIAALRARASDGGR